MPVKTTLAFLITALIIFKNLSGQTTIHQPDHFQEGWKPRVYEDPPAWLSIPMDTEIPESYINIDLGDTLAPVLPTQFGVNTPFRNSEGMLTDGIRFPIYERTKLGAFRFPAGSGSNQYFWDGNIPGQFLIDVNAIDGVMSGVLKPMHFAAFVDSLGSQATVVVNYFYARYGIAGSGTREERVQQAAEYAAGFVRRMNVELKAGIKYWEVGNECYGKWETGWDVNGDTVTGKEYGEDFRVFAEEMKKVDSTIKVGAVLYSQDTDWNPQVIPEVEDHADFFIIHNYFTAEKDATPENILSSVGQISEVTSLIKNTLSRVSSRTITEIPVALTEFNCRGPYTTNMVDAMFVTQILGEVIKNNIGLSTMWVSEWRWKEDAEPKSFLAWEDPGQPDYSPYPVYTPFYFYGKCFGDQLMKTDISGAGVKAYASRFESGEVGLALVNTNGIARTVKIDITGSEPFKPYQLDRYEVYANTIEPGDKKFYINGETGITPGGGPTDYYKVKPLRSEIEDSCIVKVKPYSMNFIVFKLRDITGDIPEESKVSSAIRIYPNPAKNYLHVECRYQDLSYVIYSISGKLIKRGEILSGVIDITSLPQGHYLLKLVGKNEANTLRFSKF